jgi:hypothetical protein
MNKKELTAPCGLDCFNCPVYEDNITPEIKQTMAVQNGMKEEASVIREKYYQGKFMVGLGPQLK